jgi:anaerobic selenocysteine-containing dehydrogenase
MFAMKAPDTVKTHYTTCPYNCWPVNCGLAVTVGENGELEIEGNPYHDVSRGRLCIKGQSVKEIPYNKERLLSPMVREGERGSGRFVPASWDTVLSRIAKKLQANIARGKREANALYHSHGNIVQRVNWKILTPRFANMIGMTLWDGNFPCWYDVGLGQKLTGYWGLHDQVEMGAHAGGVINWAQDPCASQANLVPYLLEVRDRKGPLVTIDPRVTQTAAISDFHLRPRIGSDVFLANAVAHILLHENAFDRESVEAISYGFDAYCKHIEAFTPALAARECDIEKADIERLAAIYAQVKPLCTNLSRGALGKHMGGVQMVRAILCLVPLSGNVGVAGGGVVWGEAVELKQGLVMSKRRPEAPYPANNYNSIDDALEKGLIDTLLVVGGNPLSQWPDINRLRRQLDGLDLIVVNDLFLNHTAREVADIILPATSWLEELGLRTSNSRIYLMDKVLSPRGESRNAGDWMKDLAGRMGVDDYFPWDSKEECLDDCLGSDACNNVTVAQLREHPEGLLAAVPRVPYADGQFDTDSGKFEFYSTAAKRLGLSPLPVYEPLAESVHDTPQLAKKYPLQLISARRNTHFHSFFDSHRSLKTLQAAEPEPSLHMHPIDARTRKIADGSRVRMFNKRGESVVRVELTTEVLPGHVSLNDCWPELNNLTPSVAPCPPEITKALDVGGQPAYQDTLVEIEGLVR